MERNFVDRKSPGLNDFLMFSWACIPENLIMCVTASKVDVHGILVLNTAHPAMLQCSWLC